MIKDGKHDRPDQIKRGDSLSLTKGLGEQPSLHSSSKQQHSGGHFIELRGHHL